MRRCISKEKRLEKEKREQNKGNKLGGTAFSSVSILMAFYLFYLMDVLCSYLHFYRLYQ